LTAANAAQWTKVWNASNYEPDPVLKLSYGMGSMAFFDGYLYWGTLNPVLSGASKLFTQYGKPTDIATLVEWVARGNRTAVMFRAQNFSTPYASVDLLYGEANLPVLIPPSGSAPATWTTQPNNVPSNGCTTGCGTRALFGHSGFDNIWTSYMWSMGVVNSRLYVGTMDWAFLAYANGFQSTNPAYPMIPEPAKFGGGLFYFPDTVHGVVPVSINGVGNFFNYGIRNIMPYSPTQFFVGTANPMNIATAGTTNVTGAACSGVTQCRGGWELIEVDPIISTVIRR
jgi:hypothetical protein